MKSRRSALDGMIETLVRKGRLRQVEVGETAPMCASCAKRSGCTLVAMGRAYQVVRKQAARDDPPCPVAGQREGPRLAGPPERCGIEEGQLAVGDKEYRSYTIKSFDRWARFYDLFVSLFRLGRLRREAVEISSVARGDKVLDVCTGTGAQALEFARRCDDVTGVDLSTGMLAAARKKDKDGRVRFLEMDATRLDLGDKEFDVSCISFGLHEMPPEGREQVLREMTRVTKDKIVIVDYKAPRKRLHLWLHVALISLYETKYFGDFMRSEFEALLARCGLQVEREKAAWLGFVRISLCRPGAP